MKNKYTKIFNKFSVLVALVVALTFSLCGPVHSAGKPNLGTANSFAVLAGSTITNTDSFSVITGNLGLSPGAAVTGFPPGIVNGTKYIADATAVQAQADLTLAYNDAVGQSCDVNLTDQDLGGMTLTPGSYCFSTSAQLTGKLTLTGGLNDVYVFQIGSTLTTAVDSVVALSGGIKYNNVFWQVGSSATLGTGTDFKGTVLALTSITLNTGANVDGRMLARNGAVTLDDNDIDITPQLTVTKVVTNHGGNKQVSNFPLFIDAGLVNSGDSNSVSSGEHAISETGDPDYTATITGDCDPDGTITLAAGENKACTITNEEKSSKVIIHKTVINHGLANDAAHFAPYQVGATTVVLDTETVMDSGPYVVSEADDANYDRTFTAGDCDASGNITLVPGTTKSCTITNEEGISPPATLHIIKTLFNDDGGTLNNTDFSFSVNDGVAQTFEADGQNDLSVPAGTYTITESAVSGYTASYDNCSDLVVASGGSATCTITNDDIAVSEDDADENKTADKEDDLEIKITRKADPSSLSGPGYVTYTYKVRNEGNVALKNVSVEDDKCSPVVYVSGRKNKNGKLDTDEVWKYTCTKRVSATETNKATAKGTANGKKVHDHAKATVVVSSVPGFPNTGIGPDIE